MVVILGGVEDFVRIVGVGEFHRYVECRPHRLSGGLVLLVLAGSGPFGRDFGMQEKMRDSLSVVLGRLCA